MTIVLLPGLSRAIAQYVSYTLIPEVLETSASSDTDDARAGVDGMWSEIWRFLNENKDAIKLRQKQDSFFTSFTVPDKCTVGGLLSMFHDQYGEHVPEHILTMLLAAVRSNLLYDEAGDGYADSFKAIPPSSLGEPEGKRHSDADQLQTKITPFDELQLAIETNLLSRQRNGTDRVRQDLIVCASLIDKVTNLAGIVRTCEIFAVKEVTVPDINILQNFEFQSISVASAGWMPIREVSYEDSLATKTAAARTGELVRYLREMKSLGYQIIGVEQTGASVPLQQPEVIHPKCVLVLGKEKEGIPLDILHEVDICIEIPQFGVTRSLNVHVSAALLIWEVTKRAISMKNSPLAIE
jgi:tRNA guanosine-2'-O-methyltransferase